jgi:hypothetical protein
MKPREWRERRFVEGAAALRRYLAAIGRPDDLPPAGEHYLCPCCMRVCGREALSDGTLTIEDVPPKSVGGRWLVLTCKQCNSTAGTRLDEQARLREEQLDFLAGRVPERALAAEIMVGDSTTEGDIRHVGDALLLLVDPKRSDPRQHAEMTKTLDQWAAGGRPGGLMGFGLTKRAHVVRARLSWLRAAYLVAFAALGWRYICMPYLAQLRAQLADPDATLLPPLALFNPDGMPGSRDLVVVQEPYALRSLAVVLGRYTVFLPGLEDPQPFMSLASALSKSPAQVASPGAPSRHQIPWRGKRIPWPTKPTYALDQ